MTRPNRHIILLFLVVAVGGLSRSASMKGQNAASFETRGLAESRPPVVERQERGSDSVVFKTGVVDFGGVRFNCDASLAAGVKAEKRAASPLADATDKPDYVVPEHVVFTLLGGAGARRKTYLDSPRIEVFPVEDFKRAFAASPEHVKSFEDGIRELKKLLVRRPKTVTGEIPVLRWIEGSQDFQAHLKYLSFKNGRGVMFVTHYDADELISNYGLAYIFQGLTDDGRYYVSATFPVSVPFLRDDSTAQSDGDFDPAKYRGLASEDDFKRDYQRYRKKAGARLDKFPAHKFEPSLKLFDDLIRSLVIQN